ncbi:MAG: hypothetical protein K940chlam9_01659 [Chlamydiae bacterium]|nr:hypothetical protein [Chlamydiota bacterium]
MKVLFWDNDGLVIWCKRLEKGTFAKKPDISVLNRRGFLMLLEGIVPKRLQYRPILPEAFFLSRKWALSTLK